MSDDYSKDFEQNEENEKSELNEQQAQANEASTPAEDDSQFDEIDLQNLADKRE